MADVFVDSGGSNTSPYDTWAKAATTWLTGVDQLAAGDRLIVAHDHGETINGSSVWAFPGTKGNPSIIISSTNTGGGSTVTYTKATTPQLEQITTTSSDIIWTGYTVAYGINLIAADNIFYNSSLAAIMDDCTLGWGKLNSLGKLSLNGTSCHVLLRNCTSSFLNTSRQANILACQADGTGLAFFGGSLSSSATHTINDKIVSTNAEGCRAYFDSVDLSGVDAPNIGRLGTPIGLTGGQTTQVRNCKLNAATTTLLQGDDEADSLLDTFFVNNSDSANNVYNEITVGYHGSHVQDTGIYRTAGASNGTTNFSHKVTATSNAGDMVGYRYKLCDLWLDVSSSKTFTVEFAQDGTTTALQDDEIWIEVEFPSSTSALSHVESDRVLTVTTTPADQTTSTEGWTGLSGTNVKQKCVVTTSGAGKEGPCSVWLNLTEPLTVYVDPKVDIT